MLRDVAGCSGMFHVPVLSTVLTVVSGNILASVHTRNFRNVRNVLVVWEVFSILLN